MSTSDAQLDRDIVTPCRVCGAHDHIAMQHSDQTRRPDAYATGKQRTTAQLSSAERSLVNDRMIEQIRKLTEANNKLHARVEDIERFLASAISPTARLNDFVGRSRWQRLRWLVTGK